MKKTVTVSVFRRGPSRPRRTGTRAIAPGETPQDATVLYVIRGGGRARRRGALVVRPPVTVVKKSS